MSKLLPLLERQFVDVYKIIKEFTPDDLISEIRDLVDTPEKEKLLHDNLTIYQNLLFLVSFLYINKQSDLIQDSIKSQDASPSPSPSSDHLLDKDLLEKVTNLNVHT